MKTSKQVAWPLWRVALIALSTLGLALSAYLSWHYLVGGTVIGCGGGETSGCEQVLNSRWSAIAGIVPVSGLAAGAYLAMLVCSFSTGPDTSGPIRRLAWSALLVLSGAAAGCAVWFTIVQIRIIGAFCPYCMATHITSLLLAVVVVWQALRQRDGASSSASQPMFGTRAVSGRALAGLIFAGALVTSQIGLAPPGAYRDGESSTNLPALDAHAVPLIGPQDAGHVVTLLFDYECPHCQRLHLMLEAAVHRYDGNLAFALCPTPLNTRCNPYVPQDADEFKDSCELTRIALAVWIARREAFTEFDRWMFSFDSGVRWRPRSVDAARAKAIELVGQAKFDTALTDPWIEQYIRTSVGIYGRTMQNRAGGVPKLVFGSRWVTPEPNSVDDLISILQNLLGVPKP